MLEEEWAEVSWLSVEKMPVLLLCWWWSGWMGVSSCKTG